MRPTTFTFGRTEPLARIPVRVLNPANILGGPVLCWLDRYRIDQWGKPTMVVEMERRTGWLYLDGTRLVIETEPGLFFTRDGEAVDFRNSTPTWRNLLLHRIQPRGSMKAPVASGRPRRHEPILTPH